MAQIEIELNPIDFITIGTIGPRGQRSFHLQAGKDQQLVSFNIEKEQARALGEAIEELIRELDDQDDANTSVDFSKLDMDLREPIEPLFRIAQMGLAYEADQKMIILVAQEFVPLVDVDEETDEEEAEPGVVRLWGTLEQMMALSLHTMDTVKAGRPDAKQNGRIIYYWT